MKKSLLLSVCALSVMLSANVQAFELNNHELIAASSVETTSSSATTVASVKKSITSLNTKLTATDTKVQTAFTSLVSALSTKEEATQIKAQINKINNTKKLTVAEKSAKIAEIMADYSANLKTNKETLSAQLKQASEAKKTKITNAVKNLATASYQYLDVASDAKSLALKISTNPSIALSCTSEIASLTSTAKTLKSNVKSAKNLTTQVVSIAKSAGITIQVPKK